MASTQKPGKSTVILRFTTRHVIAYRSGRKKVLIIIIE